VGSTAYNFSIFIKQGTSARSRLLVRDNTNGVNFLNVDSITWSSGTPVLATTTGTWATPVQMANGWWRISGTASTGTGGVSCGVSIYPDNIAGTGTLLVWGAQLLTAADQTATGGAYQRIAAATDYDTSNPVFRPYLAFDGTDDFMSLASAISITTDMTVVRGFGRSAAGVTSIGLGSAAGEHAGVWFTNNLTYVCLGAGQSSGYSVSTATGSFIDSAIRSASAEYIRRNGTQIGTRAAPSVAGTLEAIGRYAVTGYNNGPIYGLIVLDRELTGSELTATEQWMAGKTGATLA
jgi:hypothetical protein